MDVLLQQMLAVENQATAIIREAETAAAGILEKARQEAETLRKNLEAGLAEEIEKMIRARVEEAERRGRLELEASEQQLREETRIILERVPAAARQAGAAFVYPFSSDGSAPP